MKKTSRTIILAILACLFVFGGVIVGANLGRWFGDTPPSGTGTPSDTGNRPSLDPNAGEYVPPAPVEQASSGIAIPGWGSITIPAGKKEVVVDFPNPEANTGKYYMTFELRLKDTGEILYTSGLVTPGLHIQKISLSRALDAGTYAAVIHVQPYKMDAAMTATNNADMETVLKVVSQ